MHRKLCNVFSISLLSLSGSLFWSNPQVVAETIGSWEISDVPVSASQVSGVAGFFLNIVDSPVSVNDALSGASLLDDGLVNSALNEEFQLNYAPGVALNSAGSDLVLFDARYDAGSYAISTSFDAYTAELLLPNTSFVDSGVDRDYFFVGSGSQFPADIWGAEIDLSLLGVPLGVAVDGIRVRATNTSTDLIGVGVLAIPEPSALALVSIGLLGLGRSRR